MGTSSCCLKRERELEDRDVDPMYLHDTTGEVISKPVDSTSELGERQKRIESTTSCQGEIDICRVETEMEKTWSFRNSFDLADQMSRAATEKSAKDAAIVDGLDGLDESTHDSPPDRASVVSVAEGSWVGSSETNPRNSEPDDPAAARLVSTADGPRGSSSEMSPCNSKPDDQAAARLVSTADGVKPGTADAEDGLDDALPVPTLPANERAVSTPARAVSFAGLPREPMARPVLRHTATVVVQPTEPRNADSASFGGRAMFERRKKMMQDHEAMESAKENAMSFTSTETPVVPLSVQKLAKNKWRFHGVHEDKVVKDGLRRLDTKWDLAGILDFPKRPNGTPLLFREAVFTCLLKGEVDLKSLPMGDVSASQGDIKRLTLRQLLKLRALHLNYEPERQASSSAHAGFLATVDATLFEQLGQKAVAKSELRFTMPEPQILRYFGLELTCIVAANAVMPTRWFRSTLPPWWVWWLGDTRCFFHATDFELSDTFPERHGALQIEDMSRPDGGGRRLFDWTATLVTQMNALHDEKVVRGVMDKEATRFGATGVSMRVTLVDIQRSIASMKKVSPCEASATT
mmetsp:Transcript_71084/g.197460  ORF Transcript_71084/g.197460 Transcript_71084/m.197460 type:complete len:577 (-) Transcript_71084:88-1818(-)